MNRFHMIFLILKYGYKLIYSIIAVAFFDNEKPFTSLFNQYLNFNKNTFFA